MVGSCFHDIIGVFTSFTNAAHEENYHSKFLPSWIFHLNFEHVYSLLNQDHYTALSQFLVIMFTSGINRS